MAYLKHCKTQDNYWVVVSSCDPNLPVPVLYPVFLSDNTWSWSLLYLTFGLLLDSTPCLSLWLISCPCDTDLDPAPVYVIIFQICASAACPLPTSACLTTFLPSCSAAPVMTQAPFPATSSQNLFLLLARTYYRTYSVSCPTLSSISGDKQNMRCKGEPSRQFGLYQVCDN